MRDFLKQTFASFTGIMLFGALVTVLIFLFIGALVSSAGKSPEPEVQDKSVLVFDLSTNITDAQPGGDPAQALQEALTGSRTDRIALHTVLDTIDKAAKDKRIIGMYVTGSFNAEGYGSGFAALKEVREALERFRAAGKTITAYDMGYGKREYYLASTANTIVVHPFGAVDVAGLASEPMFFADALKKFGVGVQVTRVGKYKSAVEPYLLNKMSPENRAQLEELLGDMWREWQAAIGKSRAIGVEDLQKMTDEKGLFLADDAKERRLVDRVAYFDDVLTDLKKLTGASDGDKTFKQVSLETYAKVSRKSLGIDRSSKNVVAVVYAEGEIVDGAGSDDSVGGDRLARQLRDLRQDKDVKAVVVRVNSPGGSASASEVIQREIILTKKVKPVVVSMGTVAASGGYWIATYGDRIFAEPNTITGSIGVFGILPNVQQLANNFGVTFDSVKTGKFADLGTLSRPKTDEEMALLQTFVDRIYDQFLTKVSDSRKLPREKVAEIAQGRVWSGTDAKDLGLVDEIGGLEAAVKHATERANLGNDWKVEEYPKTKTTEQKLLELLSSDDQPKKLTRSDPLTSQFLRVREDMKAFTSLNDPLGVYARMPFNLQIK